MLQHTRTTLIELKSRIITVENSISILDTKRTALIAELMKITRTYYDKREMIKENYAIALQQLDKSRRVDGTIFLNSVVDCAVKHLDTGVKSYNLWGVSIKEVVISGEGFYSLDKKSIGSMPSSTFFEKTVQNFQLLVAELIDNINYEYKIKRLSSEIIKINRRINVLREKVIPEITRDIKSIKQHLSERERSEFIKLKFFKNITGKS